MTLFSIKNTFSYGLVMFACVSSPHLITEISDGKQVIFDCILAKSWHGYYYLAGRLPEDADLWQSFFCIYIINLGMYAYKCSKSKGLFWFIITDLKMLI